MESVPQSAWGLCQHCVIKQELPALGSPARQRPRVGV